MRPPASKRHRLCLERLESRNLLAAIGLTDAEQLLIELTNHTRANTIPGRNVFNGQLNQGLPAGTISPTPKPPVAPEPRLLQAARLHSRDMNDRSFFDHVNPDGQQANKRIEQTGYPFLLWGENLTYANGTYPPGYDLQDLDADLLLHHWTLFDSPVHRNIMMTPDFREIGVGLYGFDLDPKSPSGTYRQYQTQVYATRSGNPFLTGVVYHDANQNEFYSLGEGYGDVTITAFDGVNTFSTTTGPSGGYSLAVPAGTYTLTASGGGVSPPRRLRDIVVDSVNVKVDVLIDPDSIPPDLLEPNNQAAMASEIASDVASYEDLTLHESTDIDVFRWTASADGWLRLDVQSSDALDNVNVTVRSLPGTEVIQTFAARETPRLVAVSAGNEYLIEITATASGTSLVYSLSVEGLYPPVARDDGSVTASDTPVAIDVLHNDEAYGVRPEQIEIISQPSHGQGVVKADGTIEYVPNATFVGVEQFSYRLHGSAELVSEPANVVVHVGVDPGRNAVDPQDVDDNGIVTPLDALLVINHLAAAPPGSDGVLAVDLTRLGTPYFDVNGDRSISPSDALSVINRMAREINGGIEQESAPPPSSLLPRSPAERRVRELAADAALLLILEQPVSQP
ncbi:hypothetical protein FYK55_14995 [Roseiconus nitratireducens]|uniref:SCP domain-containing protein n=1 Tax=Roseiconus nitratireducens TaxID=2605748 RepID=A0A5M6D457_9BACT|nr:dockerin type I domain-containing protein [Roseiconus nitratireducens]KAA5542113.1 hypothetical protein FYK55_14995 [Roseiconus nitratireducens]